MSKYDPAVNLNETVLVYRYRPRVLNITCLGIVAFYKERLDSVNDEHQELEHLQLGQVSLPPEEGLDGGPEGREEVVAVHDHVDSGVEEATEGGVTSSDKLGVEYPINTNLTELYLMETFVKCLFK